MAIRSALAFAALGFVGAVTAATLEAQGTAVLAPQVLTASLAGRDSFDLYCASCHGAGGRGDGPVGAVLNTRPADLTALARRNDGSFPRARVLAFVTGTGRTTAAHGTTEMPIWGPLFRAFESDARARARLDNLITYLETLQAPATGVSEPGHRLFLTHCASCHGSDARGGGPVSTELRKTPPDLTMFAMRNGGLFPSERVRRIVDGRDVPSHGDPAMPIWGDAFRRSRGGLSEAQVKARIDAIVTYLERIQQRATY
jgi:mono/diheme cytochrome c family protein